MRLRGKGSHGRFGGSPGHVFVYFKVAQSSPGFSRVGADLYSEASIPFWAAILGCRLRWTNQALFGAHQATAHLRDGISVPPGTRDSARLLLVALPNPSTHKPPQPPPINSQPSYPPGVQHGSVLEIRGLGLNSPDRLGTRGHLYIEINIEIPRPAVSDAEAASHDASCSCLLYTSPSPRDS